MYKMEVLGFIILGSLLATTGHAGISDGIDPDGVVGCTGKAIVEPPFKKGDIE